MGRIARVVVPGLPHHVTQRGNRRMETFFCDEDYEAYLDLMAEWGRRCGVEIWAYCLMPNHVHMIAAPEQVESLARAVGEAHRRYTRHANFREGWRGYLWQGRFASFPLSDAHLYSAVRYIERNPVRAGLCERAEEYRWSSAKAHLAGADDVLVRVSPLLSRWPDWEGVLSGRGEDESSLAAMRLHARTGRPLGDDAFLERVGELVGRDLRPGRPGRPRKTGE